MRRSAAPSPLQLMAAGCALGIGACSAQPRAAAFSLDGGGADQGGAFDRDGDGLCDVSEAELGTNPALADTDLDGLPDALEAIAGSDPENPNDPSPDRIAHLSLQSGSVELLLDSAVEGQGLAVMGELVARNALDAHARRASDYFRGSVAVAGIPPDNVRDVDAEQPRFGMVFGRVRLRYRLQFAVDAGSSFPCAVGLPFDYVTRDSTGQLLARESALLIVSDTDAKPTAAAICRPVACI